MGKPSNALDKFNEDLEREKKAEENPEWQDPELLRELKEATGVDLKVPKKGRTEKEVRIEFGKDHTYHLTP